MLNRLQACESRPASSAWILGKTLGQIVLFWTFFLFVVPQWILQAEQFLQLPALECFWNLQQVLGCAIFVLLGSLGIVSAVAMALIGRGTPMPQDCAPVLVVVGPYRFLRNPMAVAGIGQGVAVGIYCGSLSVVAYALTGALIWELLIRPWEEADLERRFGAEYCRYQNAIRCWIPTLVGYPVLTHLARLPAQRAREDATYLYCTHRRTDAHHHWVNAV